MESSYQMKGIMTRSLGLVFQGLFRENADGNNSPIKNQRRQKIRLKK